MENCYFLQWLSPEFQLNKENGVSYTVVTFTIFIAQALKMVTTVEKVDLIFLRFLNGLNYTSLFVYIVLFEFLSAIKQAAKTMV